MPTRPTEERIEQRRFRRAALGVPLRLVPKDRPGEAIDGETVDVSPSGVGVRFGRSPALKIDALLEQLVEERLPVEVSLKLPEGSVSTEGQLVWWGLLGEDEGYAIRAGILLPTGWSDHDWDLISRNLKVT